MNAAEPESQRPVLVPPSYATWKQQPVLKSQKEMGRKKTDLKSSNGSYSAAAASVLRRQEWLLNSNLSLNASCSSDASTDSFCSRASTGRIGRVGTGRRRHSGPKPDKFAVKLIPKMIPNGEVAALSETADGKRRCTWVTPNTDPCYAAFHDEEWGVPVHDDKKLFELLVFSSALAELPWPEILSKRHIFREVFMEFDPVLVSKLNEKRIVAPGSTASSLLSDAKLRSIIENARQILKIIEDFGSFDRYCWSFVNHKQIVSRFRYSHQVPVKTPKADAISKDLMRRGFRSVGPTVIYSFMQTAGLTNDHLISCYRFEKCATATATANANAAAVISTAGSTKADKLIDLELERAVDGLSLLAPS